MEEYNVYFTSGLLDNRVFMVKVNQAHKDQIDMQSYISAIKDKYGQNPTVEVREFGSYKLYYAYRDGELIEIDLETFQNERYSDPHAQMVGNCLYSEQQIYSVYRFETDRERKFGDCDGVVSIQLREGKRPDLVKQAQISIWDYDVGFANLQAQDNFLLQELEAKTNSAGGKQAPDL